MMTIALLGLVNLINHQDSIKREKQIGLDLAQHGEAFIMQAIN